MKKALLVILGAKLVLLLVLAAAMFLFPGAYREAGARENRFWPRENRTPIEKYLKTWDTSHYLFLADKGYRPKNPSTVFFPLWPLVLRAALALQANPALTAWALVTVLSAAAFLLFYYLAALYGPPGSALWSLLFLLAYPGSLFYFVPYSESLFLVLGVLFFIFRKQENFPGLYAVCFLLPLARPPGIYIVLPVFIEIIRHGKRPDSRTAAWAGAGAAALLGLGFYFLMMHLETGSAWTGIASQKLFGIPESEKRSLARIPDLAHHFKNYLNAGRLHSFYNSFLDRFFFTAALACLPGIWKMDRPMFFYALALIVFPVLTGTFMGVTRYMAAVFPVFLLLGNVFSKHRALKFSGGVLIALMAGLQVWLFFRHINFEWAG